MAISKLDPNKAPKLRVVQPNEDPNKVEVLSGYASEPVVIETGAEGQVVVLGELNFETIGEAIKFIGDNLKATENARIAVARAVRYIDEKALYKQAGYETFKGFLTFLLERTAAIGWKSATSIKRYLAFVRLYLEQLDIDHDTAVAAVSHYHNLYVLAHLDRKSGELADPDKEGNDPRGVKLGPVEFEDIARLVGFLVKREAPVLRAAAQEKGLDAEKTAEVLEANGYRQQVETYKKLTGRELSFPEGGWKLADTQVIIDAVRGNAGGEGEDEAEKTTQVWVGYETHDSAIYVERIEFRRADVVVHTIEVGETHSQAMFKVLVGKNKSEIAGLNGEQTSDEED